VSGKAANKPGSTLEKNAWGVSPEEEVGLS